ncbi:hypothetical protein C5167_007922 [Papaver somniferum]|nr:hypothetical protein C5167_007922 [Papaver somniferum]
MNIPIDADANLKKNGISAYTGSISSVSTGGIFRAIFVEGHILLPQLVPETVTGVDLNSDGRVSSFTFAGGMKLMVDEIDMENLSLKCTMPDTDAHNSTDFIVTNCKFEPSPHFGSVIKTSSTFEPKGDADLADDVLQSRIKKIHEIFKVVSGYLGENPDVCA